MAAKGKRRSEHRARPNDPPLLILTSLASGEKHGYALFKDIEEFAGARLGPGTLYGAISRLEERGLIEAAAPAGRTRPYRLTAAGRTELETMLGDLRTIVEEGSTRLGRAPRAIGDRPAAAGGLS
jgi:DNA-binding PadR family transcriptional regulator